MGMVLCKRLRPNCKNLSLARLDYAPDLQRKSERKAPRLTASGIQRLSLGSKASHRPRDLVELSAIFDRSHYQSLWRIAMPALTGIFYVHGEFDLALFWHVHKYRCHAQRTVVTH